MKWSERKFKLIACDIDGTLVSEGLNQLDSRFHEIIEKVHERDIIFCLASGRQADDLHLLTSEYKNDLFYIAANGCVLIYRDQLLLEVEMTQPKPKELCYEINKFKAADYTVSTTHGLYLNPRNQDSRDRINSEYPGNAIFINSIEDLDQITDPIIKVSLHAADGINPYIQHFNDKWGEVCHIAKAGFSWLDFTNSDKGTALQELCKIKDIDIEDTMVFGDNVNDISMFKVAGHSGVMSTSHPEVQKHADLVVKDPYQYMLDYLSN